LTRLGFREMTTVPKCAECGRAWIDPTERWYGYRIAEDEREQEFEGPDTIALFCPQCAEAEVRN
jgi:hypothetical protein